VIEAIEFAVRQRHRLGIDIINLSLGHPITEPGAHDPLVQAVEAASRAGLIVVVAAGNAGHREAGTAYASVLSPANAPSALTVGSLRTQDTVTRADDDVAAYSSRGPTAFDLMAKPDVVAPGHRLRSSPPAAPVRCIAGGERPAPAPPLWGSGMRPFLPLSGGNPVYNHARLDVRKGSKWIRAGRHAESS
jgi:hypothetical protein